MKNIALIGLLLLIVSACEKNLDVITIDTTEPDPILVTLMEDSGQIVGAPSDLGKDYSIGIHDARVQLMYNGEVLDETNSDGSGHFAFPLQTIPEGAYVLVSAPGFYPNARKVDATNPTGLLNIIPEYFGSFSGVGLTDEVEVVRIRGSLQEDNEGYGSYFHFVNENNELIGNFISDATLEFDVTTLADTEIFLYHQNTPACPLYGPVPLGFFSEDQYIGNVYSENNDAFKSELVTVDGKAKTCDNNPLSSGGYYLVKFGNSTISHIQGHITPASSDRLFSASQCELEASPEITITAVNHVESLFGEYTLACPPKQAGKCFYWRIKTWI